MKNKLLLSMVVVTLCVLPILSLAETGASTTNTEKKGTIKDEIEAKKEALKQEVTSKTDALKNSVEERRQNAVNKIVEKVNKFVDTVTSRYDAAIGRLETLVNRIESRIAKMEAKNVDVTKAKELLTEAQKKIDAAKISVTSVANARIDTSLSTTTAAVKKDFEVIKTQMENAKEDMKVAHAALVDVVNSLKPGQNKLEKMEKENNASPTTEIND